MSKIIFIDTTGMDHIEVVLEMDDVKKTLRKTCERDKAQVLLGMIDDLLQEADIKIQEIDKIIVNKGPGSYTGIRVGLTIANTLGTLLGIPVNDKKPGEIESPLYTAN